MILLEIKPLSVNQAWKGKRFKTKDYTRYERDVLYLLPKISLPDPPFKLCVEVGFSNKASDIDNILKPLLDILQKKYNFDDKEIYRIEIEKTVVKKDSEYIKIKFEHHDLSKRGNN